MRFTTFCLVGVLTLSEEIDRLVRMFEYEAQAEVAPVGHRCIAHALAGGGVLVRCQARVAPATPGPNS